MREVCAFSGIGLDVVIPAIIQEMRARLSDSSSPKYFARVCRDYQVKFAALDEEFNILGCTDRGDSLLESDPGR